MREEEWEEGREEVWEETPGRHHSPRDGSSSADNGRDLANRRHRTRGRLQSEIRVLGALPTSHFAEALEASW